MRLKTILHIDERIAHANKTHGEFVSPRHAISAARIELMEAEQAMHYIGNDAFVGELLDAAVVLIRAAQQFGGGDDGSC